MTDNKFLYCTLTKFKNFIPMDEGLIEQFKPIEITTHNIYFHEESPILSCDEYKGMFVTSGFDNFIRFWKPSFDNMKYRESVYRTAANSSIQIDLLREVGGFTKPINCVRFNKNLVTSIENDDFMLACCTDSGKIVIITKEKTYNIRDATGDDAYELVWTTSNLIVGFASGRVESYSISIKDGLVEHHLDFEAKIHSSTIQGMGFNKKYNLLATHSLDKTVKIHRLDQKGLTLVSSINQGIDSSRGLFKRLLFDEEFLYIFSKNNSISVVCYPFTACHIYQRIGPLNSPVVKMLDFIINSRKFIAVCTKKSIYVLEDSKLAFAIDNCCFMAVSDAFFFNSTIFVSSMDGFMATARLTEKGLS